MLGFAISLIAISWFAWQWYWRSRCNAPGSMGWPFIGESISFIMDIRGFIRRRHNALGPVFRTHLFGSPTVILSSVSDAKAVFLGEETIVEMQLMKPIHNLMHGTLLTQHGEIHRHRRRLFSAMTAPEALNDIFPIALSLVRDELKTWLPNTNFDVVSRLHRLVFCLNQTTVFGDFDREFFQKIHPLFIIFNKGMFALPLNFPFTKYGKAIQARQKLESVISEEIGRRRMNGICKGFLKELLCAEGLTENEIIAQIILVLLAGYETSAFTINIALHTLAMNPDTIERLFNEQHQVRIRFFHKAPLIE